MNNDPIHLEPKLGSRGKSLNSFCENLEKNLPHPDLPEYDEEFALISKSLDPSLYQTAKKEDIALALCKSLILDLKEHWMENFCKQR